MGKKKGTKGIGVSKSEDIVEWYSQVLQKAELADYAPIKGFMVIRPRAYYVWEEIQREFNKVLEKKNVRNSYFPLLIPDSFFKKEANHVEGFAPELAYIKNTEDGEKLAIRPTSETIIYDSFSKWVRSWRDLPLKVNQWCNVLRWEVKQTKPFLRTREFLWQEGHCAFESEKEAIKNMVEMINAYKDLIEKTLAVPLMVGVKSDMETFPGAKETMTIEAFMPDGKALQCGTSHNLGQGFSKSFDVKFLNKEEKEEYVWLTSWGFSTRLIGAMIMLHGDDKGLVLPPKVAREKVAIVPILFEDSKEKVLKKSRDLEKSLKKFGVVLDDREDQSPGFKFNELEMKGIPVRIEVGPKDLEKKKFMIVRRDTGEKIESSEKQIVKKVSEILEDMQSALLEKARKEMESKIVQVETLEELNELVADGKIVKAYMKDDPEVEEKIKEASCGATSRFIEIVDKKGKCVQSGEEVDTLAYISRSY